MGKFKDKFSDKISTLTDAEKYLFYYLDNETEAASKLPIVEMALKKNVSTTTIMRLTKKLGLNGYSNLKYVLEEINELNNNKIASIESIKSNIINTLENINYDQIMYLVNLINQFTSIEIIAVGLSKPVGEYFSKLLLQSGKSTHYNYESHIIDLLTNTVNNNTLVIFLSNSGNTKTLVEAANKFHFKGIKTVSITNNPDSKLAKITNLNICTNQAQNNINGYDASARSTLTIIVDLIIYEISNTI